MDRVRQIAFGYSTQCNIKCEHCVASGENHKAQKMEIHRAKEIIEEMAYYKVSGISFTAGEPMIFLDDICELIEICKRHGIYTRVVTNAFWAKSQSGTAGVLSKLKDCGLSQLRISCSRWHQKHVDLNNIFNAVTGCKAHGIDYFVSFITDFSGPDDVYEQFFRDHTIKFFPEPLIYFGRAGSFNSPAIFTDYHPNTCMMNPYFSPELDMYACCDAGLHFSKTQFFRIGNLKNYNINQLFYQKENNPVYELIRNMGLTTIASYIGFKASTIVKFRKCELCEKLFNSPENLSIIQEAAKSDLLSWCR